VIFRLLFAVVAVLLSIAPASPARSQEPASLNLTAALDRVFAIQEKIKNIHPAFDRVYPIAIVRGGAFYIYEPDPETRHYRLATTAPDPFNTPVGVRAAMPLDFWGNRIACVITPEAFDDPRGFVLIFHEFVHCYQWESCELRLKEKMGVYRTAMERKDYMWELQYPFPYDTDDFRQTYEAMLAVLQMSSSASLPAIRAKLKEHLSPEDWEYMTWQEWKEGLARCLENAVAARLGQHANRGGLKRPFTRVTFYAGGEAVIRALAEEQPAILKDIEALYHRIAE